jgi:paired amphipathic helix protein Sin3a
VSTLFKGSPDLIDEFKQFLPDPTGANPASNGMIGLLAGVGEIGRGEMDRERLDKKKASAVAADKGAPPKRKKRAHEEKALPLKPVQQPKVGTAVFVITFVILQLPSFR